MGKKLTNCLTAVDPRRPLIYALAVVCTDESIRNTDAIGHF